MLALSIVSFIISIIGAVVCIGSPEVLSIAINPTLLFLAIGVAALITYIGERKAYQPNGWRESVFAIALAFVFPLISWICCYIAYRKNKQEDDYSIDINVKVALVVSIVSFIIALIVRLV